MSLTDEGRRFYDRVRPSLEEIEDAAADALVSTVKVRGRLKVNVDPYISRMLLAGRLGTFLDAYPDLALELITRNMSATWSPTVSMWLSISVNRKRRP